MKKLFFCFSFLLLGNSLPLHAAASKSKLLVGMAAAAGSAVATGVAAVANSIKGDKLELLKKKNVYLEDQINFLMVRDALNSELAWGLVLGAGTLAIIWFLCSCDAENSKSEQETGNGNIIAGQFVLEGNKK